jgi:hypothetical protein
VANRDPGHGKSAAGHNGNGNGKSAAGHNGNGNGKSAPVHNGNGNGKSAPVHKGNGNGALAGNGIVADEPTTAVAVNRSPDPEQDSPGPGNGVVGLRPIDLPRPSSETTPASYPSRLGTVAVIASVGVLIDGIAYALGRTGHAGPVVPLFLLGLAVIFAPCAWRLTFHGASRRERIYVSLVLGVGLLVSAVIRSPLVFDGFDEMIHGATLNQLLHNHSLHVTNTVLPVSPYFPGLEVFTIAVKWLTGLPVLLAQDVVLLIARALLVVCVFLVVERVCGSARAGGLGVLVYAANPQFYSFDEQYAYETLALALAVGVVLLIMNATREANRFEALTRRGRVRVPLPARTPGVLIDPAYQQLFPTKTVSSDLLGDGVSAERPSPSMLSRIANRRFMLDFVLALAVVSALAVTHHLTAWLTVAFLAAIAVVLRMGRQGVSAGVVGGAAAFAGVLVGIWTAFVGTRLWAYLEPIFRNALTSLSNAIAHLHATRQLFHTATGAPAAPQWEIVLMLAASAATCLVILPAAWAAIRGRTVRGGSVRWVAVLVAVSYPFTLLARLSTNSSDVGARASTFIFFGVAVVVGGWLALHLGAFARRGRHALLLLVLVACFLGTTLLGSGPDWSLVTGRYLVGADNRSIGAPSLAVAEWARTHIPPGTHVAADRDNGVLLADLASIEPVTAIGGLVNTGPLYFDRTIGTYERSLVRQAQIRYIVVDDRMTESLPYFGAYIEPGETAKPTRLTAAELHKFATVPGARLVYDNGPIQVYDLSGILGTPAPPAPANAGSAPMAADVSVMVAAAGVGLLVLVRIRRRRTRRPVTGTAVVRWTLGSIVAVMIGAAAFIPTHVSPTIIGLGGLGIVAAVALVATRGKASDPLFGAGDRPWKPVFVTRRSGQLQLVWTGAGLSVVAATLLLAGGIVVATLTARTEWHAPDQVTLSTDASGQTLATVQLATAAPGATLDATGPGGVPVVTPLQATTATQTLVLPPSTATSSVRVVAAKPL